MRKIDYEEWKQRRPALREARLRADNRFEGRAAGRRPRDPEKEKVLAELDKARRARYIASGKLKIVTPRVWEWRIDFEEQ